MGRVGKVKRTERREDEGSNRLDVVVDPGGGANVTAPYYAPPGEDSPPLPGDYAALAEAPGRGEKSAVGFQDAKNAGTAEPGEKRVYARDQNGNIVIDLWMKGDGTWELTATTSGKITAPVVHLDSPDVRLTDEAGKAIARVGDLTYVVVPALVSPSGPVTAVNSAVQLPPPNNGYIAAGQIVSGQPKAKA